MQYSAVLYCFYCTVVYLVDDVDGPPLGAHDDVEGAHPWLLMACRSTGRTMPAISRMDVNVFSMTIPAIWKERNPPKKRTKKRKGDRGGASRRTGNG